MLLSPPVREILKSLNAPQTAAARDALLTALVQAVAACVRTGAEAPLPAWTPHARYPVDDEGYAVAFDPVTEPEAFLHHWHTYGMVVGKNGLLQCGQQGADV